jgi:hypothetical protein
MLPIVEAIDFLILHRVRRSPGSLQPVPRGPAPSGGQRAAAGDLPLALPVRRGGTGASRTTDFDYEDGRTPPVAAPVARACRPLATEGWSGRSGSSSGPTARSPSSSRGAGSGRDVLRDGEAAYLAFDPPAPPSVAERPRPRRRGHVRGSCVERGLMVSSGGRFLALAVHRPPRRSRRDAGQPDEAMLAVVGRSS